MSDEVAPVHAERDRLHRYIASSLTLRRRLALVLGPLAVIAFAVAFVDRTVGLIGFVIVAATLGVGVYITTAHVADWRARLAVLDRGRPTAARRG